MVATAPPRSSPRCRGVQADGRFVEHVGDVGERRAEVAEHLGGLRLAVLWRARRPVEAEVTEPDSTNESSEWRIGVSRGRPRVRRARRPARPFVDLHAPRVGDAGPRDLRRARRIVEPGAVTVGACGDRDGPFNERADVGCMASTSFERKDFWIRRIRPSQVALMPSISIFGGFAVEEVVEFGLGEPADRLVRIEVAAASEDAAAPAVHDVPGDREGTLVE